MNRLWWPALVAGLSLLAGACGRKGALVYPDMLVPAAPSVTARQSGAAVKLQFSIPAKDRSGQSVQGLAGMKISRRVHDAGQKDVCRSCTTDFTLFRTIYLELLPHDIQRFGNQMILVDSDIHAGNLYSYRVVPFLADGVEGAASTVADVSVSIPLSPPVVSIESQPTEVKLHLSMSSMGSAGQVLGYNLYRTSAPAVRSYLPLNSEPVRGNDYTDSSLERGVRYRYSATALIVQETGTVVESRESDAVEGILKDDE